MYILLKEMTSQPCQQSFVPYGPAYQPGYKVYRVNYYIPTYYQYNQGGTPCTIPGQACAQNGSPNCAPNYPPNCAPPNCATNCPPNCAPNCPPNCAPPNCAPPNCAISCPPNCGPNYPPNCAPNYPPNYPPNCPPNCAPNYPPACPPSYAQCNYQPYSQPCGPFQLPFPIPFVQSSNHSDCKCSDKEKH